MSFLINPFTFAVAGGDFEAISSVTVGSGGAANIEFTSIPSTFAHLQIRVLSRDDRSGSTFNNIDVQVNADTGSNYADHYLLGDGSSAAAGVGGGSTPQSVMSLGFSASPSATASVFGACVLDILDYASTTKNKTFRTLHGCDNNGSGSVRIRSGLWMSTSAITSVKLFPAASANFAQHTTAALFGVKAP